MQTRSVWRGPATVVLVAAAACNGPSMGSTSAPIRNFTVIAPETTHPCAGSLEGDNHNVEVTIVGRGLDGSGDPEAAFVMHFGTGSLDRWFSAKQLDGTSCPTPAIDPWVLVMHTTGSEGMIQQGDSGGPMLATIGFQESVI